MRFSRWPQLLGGVLLAWCLVAALAALRVTRAYSVDPVPQLDAEFRTFLFDIPAEGTIGYLEPASGFTDDSVREHFAAQYSLAPRLVVTNINNEFLIVAHNAERPQGDPRLEGFIPIASSPSGHRLFRRFP